jgi:two-component system, NtrC family, nitrogen regulation response regulator GlnG
MRPRILIVDGDESIAMLLKVSYANEPVRVILVPDAERGLQRVAADRPNVAIFNLCQGGMPGLEFLRQAKIVDRSLSVIMITDCGKVNEAIDAMQTGAYDYLVKPLDRIKFGQLVQKALECNLKSRQVRYSSSRERLQLQKGDEDIMIGSAPSLLEIWKLVGKFSGSDPTVLIQGESGTGKELLARAIYTHSRRRDKPFLAINCAALPDSLLEAEMFGHEKGAFTDAHVRRIGKFEQCDGGTILLDEIGEMSPLSQAKLLRVLENQGFERLGGSETIRCDVRVIACTHQNLEEALRQNKFRLDLYHRLKVVNIHLPPLRERVGDIPLLIDLFCQVFSRSCGKELRKVTAEARELLTLHKWEGNIRELKNVIHSAIVASTGTVLDRDNFEPLLRCCCGPPEASVEGQQYYEYFAKVFWPRLDLAGVKGVRHQYREMSEGLEKVVVKFVLERCGHNQVLASQMLGMSRTTLRERIKRYRISTE